METTMLVDCGFIGNQEITVHYSLRTGVVNAEFSDIRVGLTYLGKQEITIPDNMIDEITHYCLNDWNEGSDAAEAAHWDEIRYRRQAA